MPLSHLELVREFHRAFGHPVAEAPAVPDAEIRKLRCRLLLEEVLEFIEASGFILTFGDRPLAEIPIRFAPSADPSAVEAADALADISYVTLGAALVWGIPLDKCFREVHRSNMSKLGPDGRPIYREDGKVLKGPDFTSPDLESILSLATLAAKP